MNLAMIDMDKKADTLLTPASSNSLRPNYEAVLLVPVNQQGCWCLLSSFSPFLLQVVPHCPLCYRRFAVMTFRWCRSSFGINRVLERWSSVEAEKKPNEWQNEWFCDVPAGEVVGGVARWNDNRPKISIAVYCIPRHRSDRRASSVIWVMNDRAATSSVALHLSFSPSDQVCWLGDWVGEMEVCMTMFCSWWWQRWLWLKMIEGEGDMAAARVMIFALVMIVGFDDKVCPIIDIVNIFIRNDPKYNALLMWPEMTEFRN